jgi:hypothetical protein
LNLRVFLLSPAFAGGERAKLLLSERAQFPLAARFRSEGAPVGEVYAFLSGLYFRGKLEYSQAFAAPPPGIPGAFVIAPGCGLAPPETVITRPQFRAMAEIPVDAAEERYVRPLVEHANLLHEACGPDCNFILLGSIATGKYIEPLLEAFGSRLLFPEDFVGRGDMSRGGLMLRCARAGIELDYVPVRGALRRGKRPPRLPGLR